MIYGIFPQIKGFWILESLGKVPSLGWPASGSDRPALRETPERPTPRSVAPVQGLGFLGLGFRV